MFVGRTGFHYTVLGSDAEKGKILAEKGKCWKSGKEFPRRFDLTDDLVKKLAKP